MPGQPIIAGSSFTAGMRSEALNTYRKKYAGIEGGLSRVAKLDIPSDKNQERFFYWESAPHLKRWRLGEEMPNKPFTGVNFTADNFEWAQSVSWRFTARQDDQTQSLVQQAREVGKNAALLKERLFFQIMLNATDNDLLSSIPNAPDGAALYATTAGGSDRFGVSNGNLLTGSGVSTGGAIRQDYFDVMAQFRRMQDTEGQPLWSDSDVDGGTTLFYGAAIEEEVKTAFNQNMVALAASTATSNAGISNPIIDNAYKIRLVGTQRITDNDMYVFLEAPETKAIFFMDRQPLEMVEKTFANSDSTSNTGIEELKFWMRLGAGVGIPFQTVKINN